MSSEQMIYKTDYHLHTYYSDGKAWPEEYISKAHEAGLSEIGFSDHLTLTEEQQDWSIKLSELDEYIERVLKLRENEHSLIVRLGLEVDYFPGREEEIAGYIDALPLDYVIGSVHFMGDSSVDLGPEYYENKDIDRIFEKYFKLVARAASSGLFDFMAHPDLVRIFRYYPSHNAEALYRELAVQLKKSGVAFEINTNGMNKPLRDFYPDRRYLHIFREEGVPVLVNSDAHSTERLGQHFEEAYSLLRAAGFTEMVTFAERRKLMRPLPF
ncbi:MAG: histidinol-phosphatase HisJ family protein [Bacteroidales bacterium]|nr:histidinol-phosphatase HisJ family protein [Bacteroidales bacterium]